MDSLPTSVSSVVLIRLKEQTHRSCYGWEIVLALQTRVQPSGKLAQLCSNFQNCRINYVHIWNLLGCFLKHCVKGLIKETLHFLWASRTFFIHTPPLLAWIANGSRHVTAEENVWNDLGMILQLLGECTDFLWAGALNLLSCQGKDCDLLSPVVRVGMGFGHF